MLRRGFLLGAAALAGCATAPLPLMDCAAAPGGPRIWLAERAWHTEIGVPTTALQGPLAQFAPRFRDASVLMFGFGKRHFMLATPPSLGDYLVGPLPGAAAMEISGMTAPPLEDAMILALGVSPEGIARLCAAIWASFLPGPVLIEARPRSLFYEASRGYSLAYTCNTWAAEMLAIAGLPVRPEGVVLSRGVMSQIPRCQRSA